MSLGPVWPQCGPYEVTEGIYPGHGQERNGGGQAIRKGDKYVRKGDKEVSSKKGAEMYLRIILRKE